MNQSLTVDIQAAMTIAVASGLFVSTCSFYEPPAAQGPTGNPEGDWTPVSDMQGVQCMDAPLNVGTPTATEARSMEDILSESYRHVLIPSRHTVLSTATERGWRVSVTTSGYTALYDVLGVEPDSQGTQARMKLQRVRVGNDA